MIKLKKFILMISLIFATICSAFSYIVNADAIKTDLIAAYNNIQTIITTQDTSPVGAPHYEEASYLAFTNDIDALGGLVGIQAVIDDALALQVDVDTLTDNINAAIDGLVSADTYNSTLAKYLLAKAEDLSLYTSGSQTSYHEELDRIKVILDDPRAGETIIDGLNTEIDDTSNLLVLRGDKTEVLNLINQIETIYSTSGDDYIPSTFTDFQDAYDEIDTVLQADILVGMTLQELLDDIDALVSEVDQTEVRLNDVLNNLILRPDKTLLIAEYNQALAEDESLYTASSYVIFTSELVEINAVISDLEATELVVANAITDLADLYDLLVLKGDITDLQNAYDVAVLRDLSAYTPNSILEYQTELTRINDFIISDDTDEAEANQALADLESASLLLVLQADREQLSILNNLVVSAYYEDINLYTTTSHEAFIIAVDAFGSYLYVNSIIADDNVTQILVDNLELTIQSALDLLVLLADNDGLLTIYFNLKSASISDYTTASQTAYNLELDRIYDLIISSDLDEALALQLLSELSEVNDLLVDLPDYTELQSTYESTMIYREEDYSVSSYSALEQSKNHALFMLSNLDATQLEVDSAKESLIIAVDGLNQKLETIYMIQGETLDINQYITLGEATITSYSVEINTILSVDNLGIVEGLKYGESKVLVELSSGAIEEIDIFVKAKLSTTVYVLSFSLPVVGVGIAASVVYIRKETWINLFKIIKNIFKKKS
ncbi:hypothetical protein RJI07_05540 [Mycoplasmatota bacterium WC30]